MAKGNLEACIRLAMHHVAPHKARLLTLDGFINRDELVDRFGLVHGNLEEIMKKIIEIREAAERNDCVAVLKALKDDEMEFD